MIAESHSTNKEALIISNRQELVQTLCSGLELEGWRTVSSNSVKPVRKLLKRDQVDLIVLDEENLPEASIQLSDLLNSLPERIPLLLVATQDGKQITSKMNLAPDGFLDFPLKADQLRNALSHIETKQIVEKETKILGRSEALQQTRTTIRQIAPTSVTVLITGENGTGKNLVAEVVHQNSPRQKGPFLILNCGAIPETLLESELFGHEKGAFTDAQTQRQGIFEAANGGTVFLDEIGEMSLPAQVRLLRVLEAHEITRLGSTQPISVSVRVLAATNLNLQKAVSEGRFRQDLYHRLRVVEINVPPLYRRPEDIPMLVDHFIQQSTLEYKVPPIKLNKKAIHLLQRYRWPGNVRELKNLIDRLMILSEHRRIGPSDLSKFLDELEPESPNQNNSHLPIPLGKTPEESHRDLLYWAILEVARDVKELKAHMMRNQSDIKSFPIYQPGKIPLVGQGTDVEYAEPDSPTQNFDNIKSLQEMEREAIVKALRITGGHRKRAAKLLNLAERTLYRKIRLYNL